MTIHHVLTSDEIKNRAVKLKKKKKNKIFYGNTWILYIPFTFLCYERTIDSLLKILIGIYFFKYRLIKKNNKWWQEYDDKWK